MLRNGLIVCRVSGFSGCFSSSYSSSSASAMRLDGEEIGDSKRKKEVYLIINATSDARSVITMVFCLPSSRVHLQNPFEVRALTLCRLLRKEKKIYFRPFRT